MANILSFSKARKSKARDAREAAAAENRVKFGRTKVEKATDESRTAKAEKVIDAHKREP